MASEFYWPRPSYIVQAGQPRFARLQSQTPKRISINFAWPQCINPLKAFRSNSQTLVASERFRYIFMYDDEKKYTIDHFQAFFNVVNHANASASMHSLVEIHNTQIQQAIFFQQNFKLEISSQGVRQDILTLVNPTHGSESTFVLHLTRNVSKFGYYIHRYLLEQIAYPPAHKASKKIVNLARAEGQKRNILTKYPNLTEPSLTKPNLNFEQKNYPDSHHSQGV